MDSKVLRDHREKLKKEIQTYNYIIGKEKNKLIQINNYINDNTITLSNYIIDNICFSTFDPKYVYNKIEGIKRLRVEKSVIEKSISLKCQEREKLEENLKGINEILCLL